MTRKEQRQIKQMIRSIAYNAKEASDGGKAAQRRRNQMLKGQLREENGVVKQYEADQT